MGDKKESKLQYVLKTSWESEQMSGWKDSLSIILEATKKEFQIKNKDVTLKNTGTSDFQQENPVIEEDLLYK